MNLQNMAPNAKRSMILTLLLGGIAAALYFLAIEPTEERLLKTKRDLSQTTQKHRTMMSELGRAATVDKDLAEATARLDIYKAALIRPLLESTAMRAKSIVDALALGCELSGMEYETLTPLDLPILGAPPEKKYTRCPIRITCVGTYQAAATFIRCLERTFPLVAVESMSIVTRQDANLQQITIVLEWPMEKGVTAK